MSKTILLTGSTDGIGIEAAKLLVDAGHNLLLHGRSKEKLNSVKEMLSMRNENAKLESYRADLSDFSEVIALANEIKQNHTTLDVLINNAGVFKVSETVTRDGLDVRFVVNTLAPYVLTTNLLSLIPKNGRVINVSSAAQAPVEIDALTGKVRLDDNSSYAQSKLAIIMWTNCLVEKLGDDAPMMVSVNPASLLGTKMVKDAYGMAGKDISIGAEILYRAALNDSFANASGKYFDNDNDEFAPPHRDAVNNQKNVQLVEAMDKILIDLVER